MNCYWLKEPSPCLINGEEDKCRILSWINAAEIPDEDKVRLKEMCPGRAGNGITQSD
jgi:hypothetical protein